MVLKSMVASEHVGDLGNIFEILRKHKLCEVNPDQIKAINSLQPPQNLKEVQKFIGMTAALNWFISRSADRCRPFFL